MFYWQSLPLFVTPSALEATVVHLCADPSPFMTLPGIESDLPEIQRLAERLRSACAHLVVLGTGGSSLGGLTLASLKAPRFLPADTTVHFVDNSDPETMGQLFAQLPLANTAFLAISKSGTTAETLAQLLLVIRRLERESLPVAEHCRVLTSPGDSPLTRLAQEFSLKTTAHDPALGGRFSVLSNVGLIPAAVAGVDIYALRDGAKSVMQDFAENGAASAPAQGAALNFALAKPVSVLMPYCDRLENLSRWYAQLWAESLGKGGQGSTPVRALGAVDQHSQLQLYLDGPRDKLITLIGLLEQPEGDRMDGALAEKIGMGYLGEQNLGALIEAQRKATATTLTRHGVPVRRLEIKALTEQAVGALLQHFMLETVLMAAMLGVDAYDQPAVEESKKLASESLTRAQ